MRWGLFMPNGSAMKAVAELVDEGKVLKCCLSLSLCKTVFLLLFIVWTNLLFMLT